MSGPGPNLDADMLIDLALGVAALAALLGGWRLFRHAGRRGAGAAVLALGALLAYALYVYATFTIRLF